MRRGGLTGVYVVEEGVARLRWLRIGRDAFARADRLVAVSAEAHTNRGLARALMGDGEGAAADLGRAAVLFAAVGDGGSERRVRERLSGLAEAVGPFDASAGARRE